MNESSSVVGGDSDDDFDWEEVVVPQNDEQQPASSADNLKDVGEGPSERPNIEITIQTRRKQNFPPKKNPKAERLYAERLARLTCHQIHTVCLLANARIRNKWLNDPLLHARLMSLAPLPLQTAFTGISRTRIPEASMRGRQFESAITRLAEWWSSTFRVEHTGHVRSRTFDEVQQQIAADAKGKGRARDEDEAEVIRSEKSLMKHALMLRGSRDTSAQLFTALCRALGIPARLVVSLQSVPWQASVGKPKSPTKKTKDSASSKGKAKAKAVEDEPGEENDDEEDEDMDMEEVQIPDSPSLTVNSEGKGKAKENGTFPGDGQRVDGGSSTSANGAGEGKQKAPPVIKLRKTRGRKLGSAMSEKPKRRARTPDPTTTPPVFWTEVFSRADTRWLPIDSIRCIINKRKAFDPTPSSNASTKLDRRRPVKVENRMVYVVAFEEDGYGRDVTPRYAREYGAKVAKVQQGGKGRREWWERILALIKRPYRLHRDDLEDEELQNHQLTEGMPTTVTGFKDHPLYALERHLRRDEVIYPLVELGKFRGEPVYPRSSVLSLKTAENWMRQGRKVREGAQPMKWVKQRAMTVNKQRAIEMALADRKDLAAGPDNDGEGFASEEGVMQGLYAKNQTELYTPDPVVDGKIPKNDFGNIDLYVPSMLPAGAAYLPYKGTAKIARQLGIDFAEAVTGFEFKKRRAYPVITGIVVAADNEDTVLEAYWEAEHVAEDKRRAKRQEQVIKRWTKLVQGLRIRQRLQDQYADVEQRESSVADAKEEDGQPQGGFLTGADDVVEPFTLPRNFHDIPATSAQMSLVLTRHAHDDNPRTDRREDTAPVLSPPAEEIEGSEDDAMEIVPPVQSECKTSSIPKSMLELAQAAAGQDDEGQDTDHLPLPSSLPDDSAAGEENGRATRTSTHAPRSGTKTPRGTLQKRRGTSQSDTRRTRKRRREDASSADAVSEIESPIPTRSLPAKRAKSSAPPVPVPTRVLRTRTPKSASKIQEEREREEAYRRATAR
ncbi:hypothetical protein AcV7_009609 [Taiwanofungus camphoratus]|nr:hypothetical protein AcV7_009609 [Antrodia cinnamomea]